MRWRPDGNRGWCEGEVLAEQGGVNLGWRQRDQHRARCAGQSRAGCVANAPTPHNSERDQPLGVSLRSPRLLDRIQAGTGLSSQNFCCVLLPESLTALPSSIPGCLLRARLVMTEGRLGIEEAKGTQNQQKKPGGIGRGVGGGESPRPAWGGDGRNRLGSQGPGLS